MVTSVQLVLVQPLTIPLKSYDVEKTLKKAIKYCDT